MMNSSFIGKVIDNYRVLESLGVGGMGVVFKAVNIKLEKLVALKMIAPGLAMNENFIKRFQTEAKALAKLADPNIVQIYDLRTHEDQWLIVMEFIDGLNLGDIIKRDGAFPTNKAISILKQMLSAIGHAHKAGIIHRDIKPNNVMITEAGAVKITDFGLAKSEGIRTNSITISGGGTLFYMSPEHVKSISLTDGRSDIYSIGMTFYEMVAGRVPFHSMDTDFEIRETLASVPNLIDYPQWASGSISLSNSGDELLLINLSGNQLDAVSWKDSVYAFTPATGGSKA